MLKTFRQKTLTLGAKLSLATLLTVAVIMAVLMVVLTQSVTNTVKQRAETEMLQSMGMIQGFLSNSDKDLRERTEKIANVFQDEYVKTVQLIEIGPRRMLLLNGANVNGDNSLLQRFKAMTTADATVFVFDGKSFKSVASSLKLENGEPAVGTEIPQNEDAHKALMSGKSQTYIIKLFNKEYMGHYRPILDSNNKIVGAYFIGMDFSAFLASIKNTLRTLKIGQQGYYFVMYKEGAQRGVIAVHPRVEGQNLWERQDSQGGKYIQHMLTQGRGVFTYEVVNGSDNTTRMMTSAFQDFTPWNWTVAATINQSELLEASTKIRWILLVLGGISIAVLTAAIYHLIRRTVVTPLHKGLAVTQALAHGDLSQRAQITSKDDEIGQLLSAINHTADSLEDLIRTVKQKANGVTIASSEIARGNSDLASRTENSASALQETAAAMEELGATVRHNADNASTADTISRQAQDVATHSGQAVSALVQTMAGIDHSSQRIADIIGVIDGIAFQTNILALNAAVEAARAGEHGRGFAVVASEVRSLASRSADAAKEIKSLIQTSVSEVRAGNERANAAGNAMEQAVNEITKVTRVISEISHASIEQSSGVAQVGQAISSMDMATQKNAALVEEMAASAESLSAQANELLQAVAVFKLREDRSQITK